MDGGSHWIRPLRMWFGEIDEVMGLLGHPYKRMEGESMVKVFFLFYFFLFFLVPWFYPTNIKKSIKNKNIHENYWEPSGGESIT